MASSFLGFFGSMRTCQNWDVKNLSPGWDGVKMGFTTARSFSPAGPQGRGAFAQGVEAAPQCGEGGVWEGKGKVGVPKNMGKTVENEGFEMTKSYKT